MSPIADLFKTNDHIFEKVLQKMNITETSFSKDVAALQQWIETQHLPKVLDERCLKNFLIRNKCSVEVVKQKIVNYFWLSLEMEDVFCDLNPNRPQYKGLDDVLYVGAYPGLTEDLHKIYYFKIRNASLAQNYEPLDVVKTFLMLQEVLLREDIMYGDVFVIDFQDVPLYIYPKLTPTFIYKTIVSIQKIYSLRVKAAHFVNAPVVLIKTMNMMRPFFKSKLFERLHFHSDLDGLKHVIPLEKIPKEFGGEGMSMEVLRDAMDVKGAEYEDLFNKLEKIRMDGSSKPQLLENDDMLGYYGNFKQLDID